MARDSDTDIMRAAWSEFEPALPITEEGIVSALGGFAVAWGAVLLLAGFLASLVRGLFRRKPPAPAPDPVQRA